MNEKAGAPIKLHRLFLYWEMLWITPMQSYHSLIMEVITIQGNEQQRHMKPKPIAEYLLLE